MDWVSILQTFGLPVALVVFFVIQGAKREERMNARVDKLDSYITNELNKLVTSTNEVLAKNTEVTGRLERWLDKKSNL